MNDEDYKGNVISNGSFSKILSPGIRLGWMECSPRCLEAFYMSGVLKSGGAANHYTAGIISSLIQLGLAESQLDMYSRKYGVRVLFIDVHVFSKHLCNNMKFFLGTYESRVCSAL